jgi:hypothetical protein
MKTVSVFEEIEENYPQPSKYAKTQVNALDEVSQSYSHQENPKLDQTRHTIETQDHESMDLKMIRLLLSVCGFHYEKGHVIMDCPFVFFHIRASIVRHVELHNVVRTLMDQP